MKDVIMAIPGNRVLHLVNDDVMHKVTGGKINVFDGSVTIPLYDEIHTVNMDWLKNYCINKVILPDGYGAHVGDIEFKPYSLKSHGVLWDVITVFSKPILYSKDPNYRLIPMYPHLAINKEGCIVNITTGKMAPYKLPFHLNSNVYPVITITCPRVGKIIVRRHRLVAMAWVPNGDYVKRPIVDHRDGDKTNCHYKNLRWVSFAENNRNAAMQGLKSDNIDVKVMDYDTGVITVFGSMTEACKYMGRSRINRVEEFCSSAMLVNSRYQIKLLNDRTNWDFGSGSGKYKVTIDGVTKDYHCLKRLQMDLFKCTGHNWYGDKLVTKLKKEYPGILIDFPPVKKRKSVFHARNVSTGEVTGEMGSNSLSKDINWSEAGVRKYAKLGATYAFKGYAVRVYSTTPWPDVTNKLNSAAFEITLTHASTKKKLKFPSGRKTAEFLGVDKKYVLCYRNKNIKIKHYYVTN